MIALGLVWNEMAVGFRANRLAATVATRDLDWMGDMWSQYDELSRHSHLRFGVENLERTLASRVDSLADQVIANYRSTLPTVRERQWRTAQENLQRALVLAPRNSSLKASLRYCEGHLHRIDGEAEKARHHASAANQHFTEAVAAFREAAELRRDWPDPFLGLARDVHLRSRRHRSRRRRDQAGPDARLCAPAIARPRSSPMATGCAATGSGRPRDGYADMPQEPEYLQRATDAYKQAQDLYERIPAFPGVALNLRRTQRAIEQVDERAAERTVSREEDPALDMAVTYTTAAARDQARVRTRPPSAFDPMELAIGAASLFAVFLAFAAFAGVLTAARSAGTPSTAQLESEHRAAPRAASNPSSNGCFPRRPIAVSRPASCSRS